jgi:NAD(P)H-dependent FMN reductase
MATPVTIIGLSGSLRRGSYNTALLRAAAALAPEGVTVEPTTPAGIPLYDGDVEARDGIPETVAALKDRIAAADGLLIATPEYNNAMPGVLKNAIDWLSRPPRDIPRVFRDRPVAILGATPGGFGTAHAQASWLPVIRALRMRPWFGGRLMLAKAAEAFDGEGELADEERRRQLAEFVTGFAAFIRGGKGG